jgi:hypothetical protein
MAESNPDMTQQDLAHWAKNRYGSSKPPSQTTISRILAKKDEFIALKEHEFKLIRRRRLSNPLLRKVLHEWISQNVWNNIPISAPIILSSAGNFWKEIPEHLREGTGEFSYRWCSQFLSKVNIQLNNVENELYNRLKVWSCEERDKVKQLLSTFDPRKIFTLSEIFLSHDLPLDKSYYADDSDFITCMLCVNIDGTEKFDPLIIGRYENFPSFEGKSSARISASYGVTYHSNTQKWLTSTLFYDWLSVLDKRLALSNRDIVLVLDDSASHRVINIKLERIRLLYTSSNPTFSPMNWGIENDFRLNFRIQQYKELISKQRRLEFKVLSKEEQNFTMAETFSLIKQAWSRVPVSRIQAAWKKSGILPDSVSSTFAKQKMFDDKLESELFQLIEDFHVREKWDVLTLLDLSVEQKINRSFLSNFEIVQSCIVENYDDVNHASGEKKRAPYSHELGKPLARLQKLGERLNNNSMDFDLLDFDPLDFYADGQFDIDDTNMRYLGAVDGQPGNGSLTDSNFATRSLQLQPMSELAVSNNVNPNFIKDEFMEFEMPWTNPFHSQQNTPARSTSASSNANFQFDNSKLLTTGQNMSFQNNSQFNSNDYCSDLHQNEKLSIVSNFLELVSHDSSIHLNESTLAEVKYLQSQLAQPY